MRRHIERSKKKNFFLVKTKNENMNALNLVKDITNLKWLKHYDLLSLLYMYDY